MGPGFTCASISSARMRSSQVRDRVGRAVAASAASIPERTGHDEASISSPVRPARLNHAELKPPAPDVRGGALVHGLSDRPTACALWRSGSREGDYALAMWDARARDRAGRPSSRRTPTTGWPRCASARATSAKRSARTSAAARRLLNGGALVMSYALEAAHANDAAQPSRRRASSSSRR